MKMKAGEIKCNGHRNAYSHKHAQRSGFAAIAL
jgi:hypothetical protein